MSRSRHSSTEYFGSPRLCSPNSSTRFPVKSLIGEIESNASLSPSEMNHLNDRLLQLDQIGQVEDVAESSRMKCRLRARARIVGQLDRERFFGHDEAGACDVLRLDRGAVRRRFRNGYRRFLAPGGLGFRGRLGSSIYRSSPLKRPAIRPGIGAGEPAPHYRARHSQKCKKARSSPRREKGPRTFPALPAGRHRRYVHRPSSGVKANGRACRRSRLRPVLCD